MEASRLFRTLLEQSLEEMRMDPPNQIYLVNQEWLRRMQDYLYWDQQADHTVDE